MRAFLTSVVKSVATVIRATACIASIAMLLTFPSNKAHSFANHFRIPEVRRAIVRHTQLAQTETDTATSVERIGLQPDIVPLLLVVQTAFATTSDVELAPQALPTRLFLRLKLGFSLAGGEDPLL
jgi:hypothetical protein